MRTTVLLVLITLSYGLVIADETTESPDNECVQYSEDCGTCVKHKSCMWCHSKADGKQCMDYPDGKALPAEEDCPLNDARWGVCWVNYKALLISVGVIGGIILLSIACCCLYCCCCRGNAKNKRKYERDMARMDRESEERRIQSEQRRAERQTKYDEIRKKYGITKDSGYSRFENE